VFVDRGYKGLTQYRSSKIYVPKTEKGISKTKRKRHSRRAAIEPVISHLKSGYRLCRNYLKGIIGDQINLLLAAAMNLWRTEANRSWQLIDNLLIYVYCTLLSLKIPKTTF